MSHEKHNPAPDFRSIVPQGGHRYSTGRPRGFVHGDYAYAISARGTLKPFNTSRVVACMNQEGLRTCSVLHDLVKFLCWLVTI
eukprot:scaffold248105_cov19-Tisochrysis_lutea.AAC.1